MRHILYLPWLRSFNSFSLDLQISKILTKAQGTVYDLLSLSTSLTLPSTIPCLTSGILDFILSLWNIKHFLIWGLYTCSPFLEYTSIISSCSCLPLVTQVLGKMSFIQQRYSKRSNPSPCKSCFIIPFCVFFIVLITTWDYLLVCYLECKFYENWWLPPTALSPWYLTNDWKSTKFLSIMRIFYSYPEFHYWLKGIFALLVLLFLCLQPHKAEFGKINNIFLPHV